MANKSSSPKQSRWLLLVLFSFGSSSGFITSGCKKPNEPKSKQKFIASMNVENMALGFVSPRDLRGMLDQDAKKLESLIRQNANDFAIPSSFVRFDTNATRQTIQQTIQTQVPKLRPQSTLLLFLSGHGSQSATILAEDGLHYSFQEVDQWLTDARRAGGPIQRVVILIGACFSGSWGDQLASVTGNTPMSYASPNAYWDRFFTPDGSVNHLGSPTQSTMQQYDGRADYQQPRPYAKQVIMITSSQNSTYTIVNSMGTKMATAFVEETKMACTSNYGIKKLPPTWGQFLQRVIEKGRDAQDVNIEGQGMSFVSTEPTFRAIPSSTLELPVCDTGNGQRPMNPLNFWGDSLYSAPNKVDGSMNPNQQPAPANFPTDDSYYAPSGAPYGNQY